MTVIAVEDIDEVIDYRLLSLPMIERLANNGHTRAMYMKSHVLRYVLAPTGTNLRKSEEAARRGARLGDPFCKALVASAFDPENLNQIDNKQHAELCDEAHAELVGSLFAPRTQNFARNLVGSMELVKLLRKKDSMSEKEIRAAVIRCAMIFHTAFELPAAMINYAFCLEMVNETGKHSTSIARSFQNAAQANQRYVQEHCKPAPASPIEVHRAYNKLEGSLRSYGLI